MRATVINPTRFFQRIRQRLIGAAFVLASCAAHAADPWPDVPTPSGAQVQTVAGDMVLNGVRARVVRFEVNDKEANVLGFYRQQFGSQRVENAVQGHSTIATAQGQYFHTVQLQSMASGAVQGTVMTSHLPAAAAGASAGAVRSAVAIDTKKMLPLDSSVLTDMQSVDAGKRSVLLLAANAMGVRANRDHVVQAMQGRGFRVTQEQPLVRQGRESIYLTLASVVEDAMVTISDAGSYRAVLINRTSELK
jgi:hypothetical protein